MQEILESENTDDITMEYERIVRIIGGLEEKLKEVTDELLDEKKPLEQVREYNRKYKEDLKPLRSLRDNMKVQLEELEGRNRIIKEEILLKKRFEIESQLAKQKLEKEGEKF